METKIERAYKGDVSWKEMTPTEKALVKSWGFVFGLMGASIGVIIGSFL